MAPSVSLENIRADSIEGYRILHPVGKGATGIVYRAVENKTGQTVALKVLYPERLKDKENVTRYSRERDIASRINHPNVVKCLGWGKVLETDYFVFEFIQGETLADLLRREGRLDEKRAAAIILDVARGLDAAHQLGIIHRDIKPGNIMIAEGQPARITDFGLARQEFDNTLTIQGTILGTPSYISPEQVQCIQALDIRTDLYSLGITYYHCVIGAPPFADHSLSLLLTKKIIEEIPYPRKERPELSRESAMIISRLARKKREERYPSPITVIEDLESFLDGTLTQDDTISERRRTKQDTAVTLGPVKDPHHPVLKTLLTHHSSSFEMATLAPNSVLFYEDDRSNEVYVLMQGKLEVLKSGRRMATIATEGALIGEMSYLLNARRSATIRAMEPSRLLKFTEKDFKQIISECPEMSLHIATDLARRLAMTNEKLKEAHIVLSLIREKCFLVEGEVEAG